MIKKVASKRRPFIFIVPKHSFVKLMNFSPYIDNIFIDYGYIDTYNTDITF